MQLLCSKKMNKVQFILITKKRSKKMKKLNNKVIKFAVITAISAIMIGCGGGGGAAGGGGYVNNSAYASAARVTPIEGSVIQFTGTKSTNTGISTTSAGVVTFTDVIKGMSSVVLNPSTSADVVSSRSEISNGISATGTEYSKIIQVNNASQELVAETITARDGAEHLMAGAWIENFTDNSTLGDIGMFVDGSNKFDTNTITVLTGIKTYTGVLVGFYHDNEFTDNEPLVFTSEDVIVTVNFGTNSEIGRITSISMTDFEPYDPNDVVVPGSRIDLQSANIGTGEGGFTTGNSTARASDGSRYTGKWGSQFYQTENTFPKYIGGTFGGAGTNIASDEGVFIGVFFAEIQ